MKKAKQGKRLAQAAAARTGTGLVEKAPAATKTEANPLMETAKDSGKPEVADVKRMRQGTNYQKAKSVMIGATTKIVTENIQISRQHHASKD